MLRLSGRSFGDPVNVDLPRWIDRTLRALVDADGWFDVSNSYIGTIDELGLDHSWYAVSEAYEEIKRIAGKLGIATFKPSFRIFDFKNEKDTFQNMAGSMNESVYYLERVIENIEDPKEEKKALRVKKNLLDNVKPIERLI